MNSFVIYLRAQSPFYKGKKINMNKKIYVLYIVYQLFTRHFTVMAGESAFPLLFIKRSEKCFSYKSNYLFC